MEQAMRMPAASRTRSSKLGRYLLMLGLSILLSVVFGSVLVLITGENPFTVYRLLFEEAFLKPRGLMVAVQRATPLIFTSAAATMAFQAGAINTGIPGQFTVGAAVAGVASYALPPMPGFIQVPIILMLSALSGAGAAFIPAIFKRMSGVSEIITGFIANYLLQYLVGAIVSGTGILRAARARHNGEFPESARLAQFVELTDGGLGAGSKANVGLFLGIGLALFLTFWMSRSTLGYEIRMTRLSFSFAQFGGINANKGFFVGMMLSGAIAALAGAVEILGVWRQYRLGTLEVGEKDLMIGLIGGQHFIGAMIAALVYGGLESGAMNVAWSSSVPRPLIDILVELIVIFAAIPSMRLFFSSTNRGNDEHLGGRYLGRGS